MVSGRPQTPFGKGATIDELFLLTLTRIGYHDGFFLWPKSVRERFEELVREVARERPEAGVRFLRWLRAETPMRYPAIAGAAIFVHERVVSKRHGFSREVVASVLRDSADPGHLLAFWKERFHRPIPKPVKRGIADALPGLGARVPLSYPSFLRAEMTLRGGSRAPRPFSLDDMVKLVHPRVLPPVPPPASQEPLDQLLRDLKRFDYTGIPFERAMSIAARLSSPEEIRAAKLLPLRLHAAREAIATRRWVPPLERAAAHALDTLPEIPGRTLLVLDHMTRAAVVFGLTLAQCCTDPEVITVEGKPFPVVPGESPLHGLYRWEATDLPLGFGDCVTAARDAYAAHDRVVISNNYLPKSIEQLDLPVPIYAWGAAAYEPTAATITPGRLLFPGLTDAAYPVIPWLESPSPPFERGGAPEK